MTFPLTKLSPNEFTRPILKPRGLKIEGADPRASISTIWIRHINPWFSAVKYLHIRRCDIVTALNKASVRNDVWVVACLGAPNSNLVRLTMKPKWNLFGTKSLMITPTYPLSYWFKWCPHTAIIALVRNYIWANTHIILQTCKCSSCQIGTKWSVIWSAVLIRV